MLGFDLVEYLSAHYVVTAIDKENYNAHKGASFDVLINANGNSRRFWANEHPLEDFEASTVSVYKSIGDFVFKKYVYISSSNVYPDHHESSKTKEETPIEHEHLDPYGLHKYMSEQIVENRCEDWFILRSSMILGRNLKKGPVYDILNGQPLFIALDTRLQMITTKAVAEVIELLLQKEVKDEVFNMGGRGTFSFEDAEKIFGKKVVLHEEAQRQIYEMNVDKLGELYNLKSSEEYLREYVETINSKI